MDGTAAIDISRVLDGFYRRKTLIACVFLVVFILTGYAALVVLPNIYRSGSLILISPQKVPTSFVTSTVTRELTERMQSIIQEILSRTQLEKIVREFDLYSDAKGWNLDQRIEKLRKAIKVEYPRPNVLYLSYESISPAKAQQVTSRIVSLFIDQNQQIRQQEAVGTKSFINAEADRLRKELEEQETVVNRYKAAHRYELPDQLDANLRTVEQLRRELEGSTQRLAALQERKGVLQRQLVESDIFGADLWGVSSAATLEARSPDLQLQTKKRELDVLLRRYSDKHPDVVRLKKEIQAFEAEHNISIQENRAAASSAAGANPLKQVLGTQIADITAEIQALHTQNERLRGQVAVMKERVDNTPIRTLELAKISRNYDITLRKFQDLLAKSLESELAENMEKKQKSEQFQILDPAYLPLTPVRPNRPLIIFIGLVVGLAVGFGLAFVWENLIDTSFKGDDDVRAYVTLPVLATIPTLLTRGNVLDQRRSQSLLVLGSLGALAVGVVGLRTFGATFF